MAPRDALENRLIELRQSFDRAFAEPLLDERADATVELLAIRVGRDPYAVRLSEVGAIEADRTITPVPSDHAELLGIAGLRGTVVAVFDLARLLGAPEAEEVRWLLLAQGAPLAFAFSGFDGQLSVAPEAIIAADASQGSRVREVARGGGLSLPVIALAGLIAALDGRPRARAELAEARRW
ncbi:MAG TPA: chemotaxis protein CheW [Polyangiaceae bacterium]|nr:chemotaxis protein CheW [Polyangiaceae bacterium]